MKSKKFSVLVTMTDKDGRRTELPVRFRREDWSEEAAIQYCHESAQLYGLDQYELTVIEGRDPTNVYDWLDV